MPMLISIISDLHLGCGKGTETEEDSFEALAEAIEKSKDADLILIAGDIFDSRVPDTETIVRCMELLLEPHMKEDIVKLVDGINGKKVEDISPSSYTGIPVVSIHGTHERRAKELLNPVQALEKAGFIIYLHCNGIVFEKNGERVCVHGMSTVPDQYAADVLEQWSPKPAENCFNIFLFHQSIEGLVQAEHLLPMKKLPKGFDLYVLGHIHEPALQNYNGKPVIVTGSAIHTQIRKESAKPLGFWKFDTKNPKPEFVPYETQRKVYIFENLPQEKLEEEMDNLLKTKHAKKPIVKIVSDKLSPDFGIKYENKVLLHLQKGAGREEVKGIVLEEHKLSVQEMGRKLLDENLKKAGIDAGVFESVFELLLEKKEKEALDAVKKSAHPQSPERKPAEPKKAEAKKQEWRSILRQSG